MGGTKNDWGVKRWLEIEAGYGYTPGHSHEFNTVYAPHGSRKTRTTRKKSQKAARKAYKVPRKGRKGGKRRTKYGRASAGSRRGRRESSLSRAGAYARPRAARSSRKRFAKPVRKYSRGKKRSLRGGYTGVFGDRTQARSTQRAWRNVGTKRARGSAFDKRDLKKRRRRNAWNLIEGTWDYMGDR